MSEYRPQLELFSVGLSGNELEWGIRVPNVFIPKPKR